MARLKVANAKRWLMLTLRCFRIAPLRAYALRGQFSYLQPSTSPMFDRHQCFRSRSMNLNEARYLEDHSGATMLVLNQEAKGE
jgi:hypothetical protein